MQYHIEKYIKITKGKFGMKKLDKKAILLYGGRHKHSEGCQCEICDFQHYSYCVEVFLATQDDLYQTDEEFDRFFAVEEVYNKVYACSELAAYKLAEEMCRIERIDIGLTI